MTPEIRAFEFALGLFTVMIGLAITDIALSLHRLVRHRATVRWDPLTLLGAFFALLMTIGMWFDLWGIRNATSVRHFFLYLLLLASFFVLFLVSASSLPDEVSGPVDLSTTRTGATTGVSSPSSRCFTWRSVCTLRLTCSHACRAWRSW